MKNLLLNLLLISTLFSYSQTENEDFNRMVEAEMKSASSTINFRANLNTQDYDITYHELRFTVDPAVYFIRWRSYNYFYCIIRYEYSYI